MGLAVHIAKRYRRGGNHDDMRQAAMIGLVKAVDRFDPSLGFSFASFAGATIEGELKRYLRDHTWVLRVPRSAKELHLVVRRAIDTLSQQYGRSPSLDEIADHTGLHRDDVLRGMAASAAYDVDGLDGVADQGCDDPGLTQALDREHIRNLLRELPEREREIVRLRFFDELSQSEIAKRLGISQMHVSRLLRSGLERLRRVAAHLELAL